MPGASLVAADLQCNGCNRRLIINGKLKCLRCKTEVLATLSEKIIFCPNCSKPRMILAKNDEAFCPKKDCRAKTLIQLMEESEMTQAVKAEVQEKTGPTKLTTKRYNELLQRWLKESKKEKRDLIARANQGGVAGAEIRMRYLPNIDEQIKVLERAIALNFDPDELEKVLNVPVLASWDVSWFGSTFGGKYIGFKFEIQKHVSSIGGLVMRRIVSISPLSQRVVIGFHDIYSGRTIDGSEIRISAIERVLVRASPDYPHIRFEKGKRFIIVDITGRVFDSERDA